VKIETVCGPKGRAKWLSCWKLLGRTGRAKSLIAVIESQRSPDGGLYATTVRELPTGFVLDTDPTKPRLYFRLPHLGAAFVGCPRGTWVQSLYGDKRTSVVEPQCFSSRPFRSVLISICPFRVCAVQRRRFSSGCKPHPATAPAGSIGAVMEVTKWLKPSISVSRIGDSASVQAATRVNAEQASKRNIRRSTRQPFRGRLIRLDEVSKG